MAFRTRSVLAWACIIFHFLILPSKSDIKRKHTYELENKKNGSQLENSPKIYPLSKVGEGGFGSVDKAILYNKTSENKYVFEDVAVKEKLPNKEDHITQEYEILTALTKKLQPLKKKAEKKKKISKSGKLKNAQVEFGGVGRFYGKVYNPSDGKSSGLVIQLLAETLDDDTFAEFCTNNPRWFWEYIAPQMIACVLEIHSVDLLHRDIKPGNFIFGLGVYRHLIYIADFGESRFLNSRWSFRHKGEQVGTPAFVSPYVEMANKYRYRDDYCSLIFSFIYLLRNKILPWFNIGGIFLEVDAKNEYDCQGIPGGVALLNFLQWARSYKAPYREKNPRPKRIWAFLKAIQMEVAQTHSGENLNGIEDNQIPKCKWTGCLIINATYVAEVQPLVAFDDSSSVLYIRLEGIVARMEPDPPTKFLNIDFVIDSPPMQIIVSLNPNVPEQIRWICKSGYKLTFFANTQDIADLASKFDLFVKYGISVITTKTLLQVVTPNDTILENSESQMNFDSNIDVARIEPFDLQSAIDYDDFDRNEWRKRFEQIVDTHKQKTSNEVRE